MDDDAVALLEIETPPLIWPYYQIMIITDFTHTHTHINVGVNSHQPV